MSLQYVALPGFIIRYNLTYGVYSVRGMYYSIILCNYCTTVIEVEMLVAVTN